MGRRNDSKKYTNPGGGANKSECPYHAAAREFKEETGVIPDDLKLVKICFTFNKNMLYLFTAKLPEDHSFDVSKDPDKEVESWEFLEPNEVKEELHIPLEDNVLLKYWSEN
jgi:8-oxo-dGTP pyrophosphatase MutT (NUDIX family)